jgi:CMP-N-acetylneuraminic acid synthetase
MNALGLIPARGGSRGIPGKNTATLAGRPLISYTLRAALESELLTRVVVSSDDEATRELSITLGAEAPFVRPEELSGDAVPALEVIRHAVEFFERQESWRADYVVYLQPTSPFRTWRHIDAGLRQIRENGANALVSTVRVPHRFTPDSLMAQDDDCTLHFHSATGSLRRQDKPRLYARNGPALLILDRESVDDDQLYLRRTIGMEMDWRSSIDIDTRDDLDLAECLMKCAGGESRRR